MILKFSGAGWIFSGSADFNNRFNWSTDLVDLFHIGAQEKYLTIRISYLTMNNN
jgi:hypothetical protein